MAFEQTWRWFGPKDPISLKEILQTGAEGIVTALHHIPVGDVWTIDEIEKRKKMIQDAGMHWTVVESLPVHENIKKRKGNYRQLIGTYKKSIANIGRCGIKIVCYNFMPVLDWSRTDLKVKFKDGSITSKFEMKVFAAFDLFILKREDAEKDYNEEMIKSSKQYFNNLDKNQKKNLLDTILLGLPGSLESYTLEQFKTAINEYKDIGNKGLRYNLHEFIQDIIPAAEKAGVFMAIHPDDPPFSLLGLPRVVSNKTDIHEIMNISNSESNGITLCTGSLGSGYKNDIVDIVKNFAERINFIHFRNVKRNEIGDFIEDNHLEGDIDIYNVMKEIILEQKHSENKRKNIRIPFRPDHGHLMSAEQNKEGIYPGYSLFGRMRGLAELRGMELAIRRSLNL
jgi:mannonate dehydratase